MADERPAWITAAADGVLRYLGAWTHTRREEVVEIIASYFGSAIDKAVKDSEELDKDAECWPVCDNGHQPIRYDRDRPGPGCPACMSRNMAHGQSVAIIGLIKAIEEIELECADAKCRLVHLMAESDKMWSQQLGAR